MCGAAKCTIIIVLSGKHSGERSVVAIKRSGHIQPMNLAYVSLVFLLWKDNSPEECQRLVDSRGDSVWSSACRNRGRCQNLGKVEKIQPQKCDPGSNPPPANRTNPNPRWPNAGCRILVEKKTKNASSRVRISRSGAFFPRGPTLSAKHSALPKPSIHQAKDNILTHFVESEDKLGLRLAFSEI